MSALEWSEMERNRIEYEQKAIEEKRMNDMLDIEFNPFIAREESRITDEMHTWATDDVAHFRAYKKLRHKVEFYKEAMRQIENGDTQYSEEVKALVVAKLAEWQHRLNQAIYN